MAGLKWTQNWLEIKNQADNYVSIYYKLINKCEFPTYFGFILSKQYSNVGLNKTIKQIGSNI